MLTNVTLRNLILFIPVVVAFPAGALHADCIDPFHMHIKGSIEAGAYRLNIHAEGSVLCIATPPRYCRDCKVGSAYECRGQRWRLTTETECGLKKTSRIARSGE